MNTSVKQPYYQPVIEVMAITALTFLCTSPGGIEGIGFDNWSLN